MDDALAVFPTWFLPSATINQPLHPWPVVLDPVGRTLSREGALVADEKGPTLRSATVPAAPLVGQAVSTAPACKIRC